MRNIVLLGFVSLFTDISSEMIYPLIGIYLTSLGTPYTLIGLIEGIAESIANIIKIFSGTISDKYRKRKIFVLLGYFGSALGKLFLFLSNTWPLVLFARVIDRFGKGVRTSPRDALIAESTSEEKKGRVFGLHRSMDTLGAICGILIVYFFIQKYINDFNVYKKIFLYATIPAVIGVVFLFFVKDSGNIDKKNDEIKKVSIKFYKYIPQKTKIYILISTIFAIGNSSNQFLLLKSKSIGFDASYIILFYLVYNLSYFLFSYPAGVVGDNIGKKKVIMIGYLIYSLVYLLFGLINVKTKSFIWILFLIYGIYMSLVEGQEKAFLSELSPEEHKASVLGLQYTFTGMMLFPSSLIAGSLWDLVGHQAPFIFSSIISFISFVMILVLI